MPSVGVMQVLLRLSVFIDLCIFRNKITAYMRLKIADFADFADFYGHYLEILAIFGHSFSSFRDF